MLLAAPSTWMNRFRLNGAKSATALAALATCSSILRRVRRAQSALYLVTDHLVTVLGGQASGPGLGEDVLGGARPYVTPIMNIM
jgi:hypothetical protein